MQILLSGVTFANTAMMRVRKRNAPIWIVVGTASISAADASESNRLPVPSASVARETAQVLIRRGFSLVGEVGLDDHPIHLIPPTQALRPTPAPRTNSDPSSHPTAAVNAKVETQTAPATNGRSPNVRALEVLHRVRERQKDRPYTPTDPSQDDVREARSGAMYG